MHKKVKLSIIITLLFCIMSIIAFPLPAAAQNTEPDKKVVILVMDYIDVSDLISAHTPNLDKLIENSGTGLMNIRSKNLNPSSSYMSIAVGTKVGTVSRAELSFNTDEEISALPYVFKNQSVTTKAETLYSLFTGRIPPSDGVVNIYTEMLKNTASKYTPAYEIGQIGKIARENNLRVGVIGNGDTLSRLNRNIALLGMDEDGIVPCGNVSQDLLETSPLTLGGMRTNHKAMLDNIQKYLPECDILFIDLGDTTRIESDRTNAAEDIIRKQREQALERNDQLIGQILQKINFDKTMLVIITPNPSAQMVEAGNFALTPIIVHYPNNKKGLLTSPTTRREGIVASADVLPSIFAYLDSNIVPSNQGMQIVNNVDNNLRLLEQKLTFFKQLRTNRKPLNISFMLLALAVILLGHFVINKKNTKFYPLLDRLIISSLCIPVIFLFLGFTNYNSIIISILLTLLLAFLLSAIILRICPDILKAFFTIAFITVFLLISDVFCGSPLMLNSPLGSDVIAGGRFYGIGNDYMGILLSCAIITTILTINKLKLNPNLKALLGSIPLLFTALVIGYPKLGANVGGFISTLFTTGIFLLLMQKNKLNFKKIIIAGIVSVLAVVGIASLDAFINPNPSHAGKAIQSLLSGGREAFFSIIRIKLGILVNTVYKSIWTLVLITEVAVLVFWKLKKRDAFLKISQIHPYINQTLKILAVAAATVFLVNDTGVIAASFILFYMVSLMWLTIKKAA
ncbi:hypothetical protein [Thermosyntropha sp.]|uniref:hypothetical protein n=1 Tax=Thermosyntropha sp. TaxID=2740820 RepID=UPI0025F08BB5|nr:hypothetical protein [Thermosyntropha sp.]MBO8159088.1 oligosaccharide repeat unit polymerase [Thermosyntropha sp.]